MRYVAPMNKFGLDPGQWTDDASMGLCLADSLLYSAAARCQDGALDGSDLRCKQNKKEMSFKNLQRQCNKSSFWDVQYFAKIIPVSQFWGS